MKLDPKTFLPILGCGLLVLAIYNSCQGPLSLPGMKSGGFRSATLSCNSSSQFSKMTVEQKQQVFKSHGNLFDEQKVHLGLQSAELGAQGKASSSEVVPKNTDLAVLIDNDCVLGLTAQQKNASISAEIAGSLASDVDLKLQTYPYKLAQDKLLSDLEEMFNADLCVRGVSYNERYKLSAFQDTGQLNDSYLVNQKHFNQLNAAASYKVFYNKKSGMDLQNGAVVTVAVLDTGIDWTHPDLAANIWRYKKGSSTFWGIDATTLKNTIIDYNPHDNSSLGHGTHVSGIIAGVSNNNSGIAGLAPYRVKIMAVKVFELNEDGDTVTSSVHVANGIRWAADQGADVINLSLNKFGAGAAKDVNYESALQYAISAGTFVVSAVGNSLDTVPAQELNNKTLTAIPSRYATAYKGMVSVASIDAEDGNLSQFSMWGKNFVEISAPGSQMNGTSPRGILSTFPTWVGNKSGYGFLEGTSMATPMVSAAAALAIGLVREMSGKAPTPAAVENLILGSATKVTSLNSKVQEGRQLNLKSLAEKIAKDYAIPGKPGNVTDLSSVGCP